MGSMASAQVLRRCGVQESALRGPRRRNLNVACQRLEGSLSRNVVACSDVLSRKAPGSVEVQRLIFRLTSRTSIAPS